MMQEIFKSNLAGHAEALNGSFDAARLTVLEAMAREFLKAFKSGRKILFCGNGGSAADAQHIAAEFTGRFKKERRSLPAIAITTDTSALTAIANDYDYDRVFSRQVEGLGQAGDVLIAISTSGNSKSILEAVKQAKQQQMVTLGFTGKDGGILKGIVDICYQAQSSKTSHIQEMHITALHALSEVVENVLFGN